ncbi:MAG: D-alanyl-D-alanine carboxypeptidase [Clostridium sp.]|nr:D-alanyl-D-alanine carboxypeptidase [Bacteroides sp.]MCM1197386.1 D-alanyl-D-alanine carboxypeptidase [Clostridium sp.]
MKKTGILAAMLLAASTILASGLHAQTGTSQKTIRFSTKAQLDACLGDIESCNSFKGASVGILAVSADGDTLLSRNCSRLLVPASNMKAITTGLALHSLGSSFRYGTRIGYSGHISDGRLNGDLYIIGGGDPTLFSPNSIAKPRDMVFQEWCQMLAEAGIREIDGYIIGDGRVFPGMAEQESWQLNDSGTYYGTGVSGLSFYENVQSFRVAPGEKPGDPVHISPVFPEAPWMKYIYSCTTGDKGTGNTLYFYTTGLAPVGEMRGTFAIDRKPRTEEAANKFPEYTCAYYFTGYLKNKGIPCCKGPADLGTVFSPAAMSCTGSTWKPVPQEELKVIGSTMSPPLARIVQVTNRDSNNLYAEALMKTLGMVHNGNGTYSSAYMAAEETLKLLGLNPAGAKIRDGSGLSRENLVSPEFFCSFLAAMMDSPSADDYIGSFPYPGGEGTLKSIMKSTPDLDKARIRMKSGSMGGTRCFCGYILPRSGAREDTIIFSVMVNNYNVPLSRIQARLDQLIALLAACN